MSTLSQQVLHGNFQSDTLQSVVEQYRQIRGDIEDLPSDAILNTTLVFLRALFYVLPTEHTYRWEGDLYGEMDSNSGILIAAEPDIHPEEVEHRPAVLLSLDGRKFAGLHLDQFKHHNLESDSRTQHDLIMGSLKTDVIDRNSKVCRRLADWIGLAYRLLVRYLTFDRFHAIYPEIGWSPVGSAGEKVRGSEHEYRMASVVFRYSWGWTGRTELKPDVPGSSSATHYIVSYGHPDLDVGSPDSGIVERDEVTHILEVERD